MMSKKQWISLLILFVSYLLIGASIFYHIERAEEKTARETRIQDRNRIMTTLQKQYACNCTKSLDGGLDAMYDRLEDFCGTKFTNLGHVDNSSEPIIWDFYNSFFFVVTVVSTIGYGNLHPTTLSGRILMIFYALIGIPMNGILFATLGDFFSMAILNIVERYKKSMGQSRKSRTWLITDVMRYLLPGFVMFVFLPALVFRYMENWSYDEAVYYAFVTLTTIGFGDLVAGQNPPLEKDAGSRYSWYLAYRIMLMVWVIFGLGYMVMIVGFITRGMRSKRMARLEHKLAHNLKHTHHRIWHGVAKDMSYLRRVLNELYLQKLKPVYREEFVQTKLTRSKSDPCLKEEKPQTPGDWKRRRANSESHVKANTLARVLSENDLTRIDRDATFRTAAMVQPAEFLASFVTAMGVGMGLTPRNSLVSEGTSTTPSSSEASSDELGIHGFSDRDILASERTPRIQRARANSEVRIPVTDLYALTGYNPEWTWSGEEAANKAHELMKARKKSDEPPGPVDLRKRFSVAGTSIKQFASRFSNPLRTSKRKTKTRNIGGALFSSVKQDVNQRNGDLGRRFSLYPCASDIRRASLFQQIQEYSNLKRGSLSHAADDSGSLYSDLGRKDSEISAVLEETTLGDFLRAISSVHSKLAHNAGEEGKRKMGAEMATSHGSLQSLFNPKPVTSHRRFSAHPLSSQFSGIKHRKSSLSREGTPENTHRRMSLRPAALRRPSASSGSAAVRSQMRRFSVRPSTSTVPSPISSGNLRQKLFKRQISDTNLRPRRDSLKDVVVEKPSNHDNTI